MKEKKFSLELRTLDNKQTMCVNLTEMCTSNKGNCPLLYFFCPFKGKLCEYITVEDWSKIIKFKQ